MPGLTVADLRCHKGRISDAAKIAQLIAAIGSNQHILGLQVRVQ